MIPLMRPSAKDKTIGKESRSMVSRWCRGKRRGLMTKDHKGTFWTDMICILTAGRCLHDCMFVKARQSFTICFPGGSAGKRTHLQWGRPGFDPWVGKIPCRRRIPTPVFWPGEFHGLYSPWGQKQSDVTERLSLLHAIQFGRWVMSDSFRPQHAKLPCPSPTPRACSNSCPLSRWCHPTISSSVVPFSSHLQSSPASGSFPISQFFASGGQSIGASASASVLPMNIQDWFPLRWTGWISLQSKGLSAPQFRSINSSALSFL